MGKRRRERIHARKMHDSRCLIPFFESDIGVIDPFAPDSEIIERIKDTFLLKVNRGSP